MAGSDERSLILHDSVLLSADAADSIQLFLFLFPLSSICRNTTLQFTSSDALGPTAISKAVLECKHDKGTAFSALVWMKTYILLTSFTWRFSSGFSESFLNFGMCRVSLAYTVIFHSIWCSSFMVGNLNFQMCHRQPSQIADPLGYGLSFWRNVQTIPKAVSTFCCNTNTVAK